MTDLADLLARARQRDPEAALALADLIEGAIAVPERRISAAFKLKPRGGVSEHRATLISERNAALRALAALFYGETPIERQAREVIREVNRYAAAARSGEMVNGRKRILLAQIIETGLPVPRLRQMKKILAARPDA
jgi:hypothetical protein